MNFIIYAKNEFLRIDYLLFVFSLDIKRNKNIIYLIINQMSILRNMHNNVYYKYAWYAETKIKENKMKMKNFVCKKELCINCVNKNWLRVTRSIRKNKTDTTMLHSDCPSLVVQLRVETLADITSNLDEPRTRSSRTSVDEKETSASFLSIVIKNNRIINVQFERLLNHGLLL